MRLPNDLHAILSCVTFAQASCLRWFAATRLSKKLTKHAMHIYSRAIGRGQSRRSPQYQWAPSRDDVGFSKVAKRKERNNPLDQQDTYKPVHHISSTMRCHMCICKPRLQLAKDSPKALFMAHCSPIAGAIPSTEKLLHRNSGRKHQPSPTSVTPLHGPTLQRLPETGSGHMNITDCGLRAGT